MANLITANRIEGAAVYGVEQMSYAVDGVSGQDYAAALSAAAFKEAVAIEAAVAGYAEVVRQRIRKLDDLGGVLAILNMAAATLKTKETESGDLTSSLPALKTARDTAAKYGVSISVREMSAELVFMTRGDIWKAQNGVQYAIDKEDNDLKQDTVSLNSYMSKRDNAFSTASKLVKKANNAASATIENIGG
ncbi:MAG: hypothetical protein IJ658_07310 [Kiritimatiellae bacterium]|nr:hypothetical protein [Kiritimatiellia bacterium]